MESQHKSGVLLLLGAALVFVGINYDYLSAAFFPVSLAMVPLGLAMLLKGNRGTSERAKRRTPRGLNPIIRSVTADAFADRQARGLERGDLSSRLSGAHDSEAEPSGLELSTSELELTEGTREVASEDDESWLSTDVSYPVETQERSGLAKEIRNLQRLLEEGVIDHQEFAAAKAKLLR